MPPRLLLRIILPLLGVGAVVCAAVCAAVPVSARTPAFLVTDVTIASLLLLGGYFILRYRRWQAPVQRLQQATERMGRGEWNIRVQPDGAPPVRDLASHLNDLAAQAQKQLSDLQQQRGGLQTLVDTLPDPILATDMQGRIILLNTPACRLLSLTPEQALNQKLVNVVNDEPIVELYESLIAGARATPLQREIRLVRQGQRCIYQSVATRTAAGGSLLVLRDVSTLAGAVQMKTDFVANASHELRTPIAAIKIAFETLRDVYREDPEQSERCIGVIDGHLKRLEEMLRDLLDLSRVENPDVQPHVSMMKTAELLTFLKSTMGTQARQKNVELRLGDQDPAAPEEFRTDARLLNLILKNLVENSIKFTPPGGRVTVSVHEIPAGGFALSVADTGIGIAPEHIDRVFERFYQVDSARSGSAGRGTGLGLAIVKHAVAALNGIVKIQSTVGAGTTVTCEFPQPEDAGAKTQTAVA